MSLLLGRDFANDLHSTTSFGYITHAYLFYGIGILLIELDVINLCTPSVFYLMPKSSFKYYPK
jgi:hypothetical protein